MLTEFGIRPTEIGMAIAIELEMLTALHASKILKQRCSLILASIKQVFRWALHINMGMPCLSFSSI